MIALKISDIKDFIHKLLTENTFNNFLLTEAVVCRNVTYSIDGKILDKAALTEKGFDPSDDYLPFSEHKASCYNMMKGSEKPAFFKFVFMLSHANEEKTIATSGSDFAPEDISGMMINFIYKNDILTCTTGISYKKFSTDKTLDHEWDRMVQLFLKKNGIPFEAF